MIQISLIAILAIIMLSVVISQNYNILSLFASIFVSHISALFFLLLLVLSLVVWIMVRMNKLVLLYSVSFSLLALTIIISLFYATNVLMNQPSLIKPYPIQNSLQWPSTCRFSNSFRTYPGYHFYTIIHISLDSIGIPT